MANEAKIGTVEYATLKEAFAAAKKGDTITLLTDITLTEQINITDQEVLSGITLDGDGHTITCATTNDPRQGGGSALYFGNANDGKWATGISIKNLNMEGKARFAIFLCGGTTSNFENVNISGEYYIAVNLYGTHGATFKNCDISNSFDGAYYDATVWTNVAAQNPIILENSKIDRITINGYTEANTLAPKIFVDKTPPQPLSPLMMAPSATTRPSASVRPAKATSSSKRKRAKPMLRIMSQRSTELNMEPSEPLSLLLRTVTPSLSSVISPSIRL